MSHLFTLYSGSVAYENTITFIPGPPRGVKNAPVLLIRYVSFISFRERTQRTRQNSYIVRNTKVSKEYAGSVDGVNQLFGLWWVTCFEIHLEYSSLQYGSQKMHTMHRHNTFPNKIKSIHTYIYIYIFYRVWGACSTRMNNTSWFYTNVSCLCVNVCLCQRTYKFSNFWRLC